MAFALALDTYASTAFLDNGMTDGESETCALNEVVKFDEAFEDAGLLLGWDAYTRVFAIEVNAVDGLANDGFTIFGFVSYADVSLLGVFYGIGNEVGEQLLQTPGVEHRSESGVGIVLLEFNVRCLYALLE